MLNATPLLRIYAQRRLRHLARALPAETQTRELLALTSKARDTKFGRDHDFANIQNVADFQARVPLRRFEDFWSDYWEPVFPHLTDCSWPGTIPYFAVTSGTTTGITKFIPCSAEMMASNRKASFDLLSHHINNRPDSRVLAGRSFMLGGSTDLIERAPGIHSGDLSGIAVRELPWWVRPRYFPPQSLALIADWEEKIDRLTELSSQTDIRSISGTPSWLLIFFDKLASLRPDAGPELANYFPDLDLLIHGGVNFAPYRKRFDQLLAGGNAELREVYPASEGFIGVADQGPNDGLRLMLDSGIFMEFVPVQELDAPNPTRHWIDNVETGVNYAIILSNCSGMFGHILGDTVEFVTLDPPRVRVTGRTSYMLSPFGEHLIGAEIEQSVSMAADRIGATLTDYSVGALFSETEGELGGHLYVIEFANARPNASAIAEFAETLDRALCDTNEDYEAHRADGYGLMAPEIHPVAPGTFAAWMKSRGQLGGQHKVPRVINDADLFDGLKAFVKR
jgi:hypothetical protein